MALPVGVTLVTNIKGPKGDTGTIDFATADTLPAGSPATVQMVTAGGQTGLHLGIPQGVGGMDSVPADVGVANYLSTPGTETREAALDAFVNGLVIRAGRQGVVGDGTTDDTAAIQAIVDACPRGGTVYLTRPASGTGLYRVTGTITVRQQAVRIVGPGYSRYWTGFSVPAGVTAFRVEVGMVTFKDVCFAGDGGDYGAGATAVGIEFMGTTAGDVDGQVIGGNFSSMAEGVRVRGRNLLVSGVTFSHSLCGVHSLGMDPAYHTTATDVEVRGIRVESNRFHGVGATDADAAILFDNQTDLAHPVVRDNYHDVLGRGKCVRIVGASGALVDGAHIANNTFADLLAAGISLSYVSNALISGNLHTGHATTTYVYDSIELDNCQQVDIVGMKSYRAGRHNVNITASSFVRIITPTLTLAGRATTGHGINIDSASTAISIVTPYVQGATGYGINGSPTDSSIEGGSYLNATQGRISSTTLREETVVISAASMSTISGTPTPAAVSNWPVQTLPDGASTWIGGFVTVPAGWRQFDIEAVIAPMTAGSGDVRLSTVVNSPVEGAPLPLGTAANATVTVTGDQYQVVRAAVMTFQTAPVNGVLGVRIARAGADAADTYTGALAVIALRLIRRR